MGNYTEGNTNVLWHTKMYRSGIRIFLGLRVPSKIKAMIKANGHRDCTGFFRSPKKFFKHIYWTFFITYYLHNCASSGIRLEFCSNEKIFEIFSRLYSNQSALPSLHQYISAGFQNNDSTQFFLFFLGKWPFNFCSPACVKYISRPSHSIASFIILLMASIHHDLI